MDTQTAGNEKVSKGELIKLIAEDTGMKQNDVRSFMSSFIKTTNMCLLEHKDVQLTELGTLEVRQRQARQGVKPGTAEKIEIPASMYPAFKPSANLKRRLNGA